MKIPKRFQVWFELCRVPNLFTVPGDPLAGYLLAATSLGVPIEWMDALLVVIASLSLYCFGLLQNDLTDYEEDCEYRPERPLPSRRVTKKNVEGVMGFFSVVAIICAFNISLSALIMCGVVWLLVNIYNLWAKSVDIKSGDEDHILNQVLRESLAKNPYRSFLGKHSWNFMRGIRIVPHYPQVGKLTGIMAMGACRGANVLLGAACVGFSGVFSSSAIIAALGIGFYIVIVTKLARFDTESYTGSLEKYFPTAVLCLFFIIFALFTPFFTLFYLIPIIWTIWIGLNIRQGSPPTVMRKAIGSWIKGLIPIQFSLIASTGSWFWPLVAMCALFVGSTLVAKRFHGS